VCILSYSWPDVEAVLVPLALQVGPAALTWLFSRKDRPVIPEPQQAASTPPELIDTKEVARRLGLSSSTVRKWSTRGVIPQIQVSPRLWRYDWWAVVAALQARGRKPAA
jgi:predicted DNA-binding transcriptional regulator AlpA